MSKRIDRVNEVLKRELSNLILKEFEFKTCIVTVSAVDVTQDFKEAKVFVSVIGAKGEQILHQLKKKRGLLQRALNKRITLRNTPVLDFREDTSAVRGVHVINLLDEVDKLPKAPEENASGDNPS